jgi:hypothetical protein
MRSKLILSAALLAATSVAFAQAPAAKAPAASQPTAEQQAAQARLNQQITGNALQVARMIDANKIGEVWDSASSIAKQAAPRDAFIKQISADRKSVGALTTRTAHGVGYSQSNGKDKNLPAGIYANVTFATKFANTKEPVRELVSFHLEADRTWRVTGYTLR